ncbi:APC family permease [Nitrosophilus alvini]|uniref:APC family permease n=1 Tax=Nitrosophilus alvini TaxID=2714855 RepID=UPI00190B26C1|nr:APC family permease [Nitrosophilus alvini]
MYKNSEKKIPESEKLGLKELVAIAIGSMIGGGIFSVLGMADQISGHATFLVFVLGGIIALFAGYNYAKLAVAYKKDGASYTYLKRAFPKKSYIAAFVGWSVIVGYIGTLALYAYTFGSYASAMFGFENSILAKDVFGFLILTVFLFINLMGVKTTGRSEDLLVYLKLLVLLGMGIAGLYFIKPDHFTPLFDKGVAAVFLSGAIVFVAFEGFQLVTNSVEETKNPEKNIPRSIYISVFIVTLTYVILAIAVTGILTPEEILKAEEYAVAEALKPAFGKYGFIAASLAALFATSSAINGTFFGASRMMADIAKDGVFPRVFSKMNGSFIPKNALFFMYMAAALFVLFGKLDAIISFSSMTFLLVSFFVTIANLKLYKETNSSLFVIILSILLMLATLYLMIDYLAKNEPQTLYKIVFVYAIITVSFIIYRVMLLKKQQK